MTSVLDFRENLTKIESLLKEIDGKGVQAVFLPECFYSMSNGSGATPHLVEFENEHYKNIQELARTYNVALIGGTAASLVDNKVINRAFNFSSEGTDLGHYDKNHLFSCDFVRDGSRKKIDEGDVYTPATDDADEVVHSSNVEQPETLEDGQQWRETAEAVMGTRSVPDYQGIDQSKLVPLLTAALQEALSEIADLKTRVAALETP